MALTIEDLNPKPFKVEIRGIELTSKPLRLSHVFILSKVGAIFENPSEATQEQIMKSEEEIDKLFGQLIPELKDIKLNMQDSMTLITKLMENVQPEDNKELADKGVTFDADPKAKRVG